MTDDPIDIETSFGDERVNLDENGLVTARSFQAMSIKMLNADQAAWNQVAAQLFGDDMGADSPLAIVMRVRAALVAGRLDSVRDVLSDRLYNRWRLSPPKPPTSFSNDISITMSQSSDEEGVATVTVGAGMTISGASEETWRFVRGSAALAPSVITAPLGEPGDCPNCGAPFEAGATACRYCGAALAVPAASVVEDGSSPAAWIVDDVVTPSSLAA